MNTSKTNLQERLKSAERSYAMCKRSIVAPPEWTEKYRREVARLKSALAAWEKQ